MRHHIWIMLAALAAASPAAADPTNYVAVIGPSAHPHSDAFDDRTFGLSVGTRRPLSGRWIGEVEGGVFRNSFGEASPFLVAGASHPVADVGPGTLFLGAAAGIARYAEVAERGDLPSVGGFVPVAYLTARYQTGRVGTRLVVVPPVGEKDILAVNLSLVFDF